MSVPNNNTFSLDNVRTELGLASPTGLGACFTASVDSGFDAAYKGSKDRLSNFRNYSHRVTTGFSLYSGGGHGEIYSYSMSSWADARSAVNGYLDTSDPYRVGVFNDDVNGVWTIWRTFLAFNLGALSGKTIYSAKLEIGRRSVVGGSSSVYAVMGSQNLTLEIGDFHHLTFDDYAMTNNSIITGESGCLDYLRLEAANSTQLANIQSQFGGILKLCLIHQWDSSNTEPEDDEELRHNYFQVGECLTNCICAPSLVIVHSA